jgi:cyclopropane-fatty-acyl-phospholipid synthase
MHEPSVDAASVPTAARSQGFGRAWARFDEAVLRFCARLLGSSIKGCLRLTLPSGASVTLGSAMASDSVTPLLLNTYAAFWRSLRRGSIGFAESYLAGEIDSDDLVALFRFFIDNRMRIKRFACGSFRVHGRDRAFHHGRANTRDGSRANVSAHYGLGNEFYRLWLDSSLTYSSALYKGPDLSLEAAQQAKYAFIFDAIDLTSDHHLLEIGCGWGAFARQAATRGARVTGLTLSREQLTAARDMMRAQGLEMRVDLRLEDYRDAAGIYDRIVSIEMIEAVGEENWSRYFSTLRDRLAPGGIVVLQAITIEERLFDSYRSKVDFIQRYIFPGGMLPTRPLITQYARAAGFDVELLQAHGLSYARTLAEWRRRFHMNWPSIRALGFDERFRRMWDYYLAYCQAGFEGGTVDVGIYRLRQS